MTPIKNNDLVHSDDAELELDSLAGFQESVSQVLGERDAIWEQYRVADQEAGRLKESCKNLQPGTSQAQLTPSSLSDLPGSSRQIVQKIHEDAARISTLHKEIVKHQSTISALRAKVKRTRDLWKLGAGVLATASALVVLLFMVKGC